MEFLTLRAQNFLTLGDSGNLALNGRGLVLIQGINEDDASATSNGAGKSSIPDALLWCLYGVTARGESGDAVVNNLAKKDCVVTTVIQDGETIYEIRRHRKHKEFKNATCVRCWNPAATYPTGHHNDLTKGTEKETQELIENILGCSYEVFMASIYAGQEMMPDLPKMTDKQLKLLIEEAAGVERLEAAYRIASARENEVKSRITNAQSSLERATGHLASCKASLHSTETEHKLFEEQRPDRAAAFEQHAKDAADRMRQYHAQYVGLKATELAAEQKEIEAKLADHSKLLAEHRRLGDVVAAASREVASHEATVRRSRVDLDGLLNRIKNIAAEMAKPCPECGKPHTPEEEAELRAHLTARAKEQGEKLKGEMAKLEELKAKHAAAVAAQNDYGLTIPDVSALSARQAEIAAVLNQANDLATKIKIAKKDYDSFKESAGRVMTEPNPHQSAIDVLTRQIAGLEENIRTETEKLEALKVELEIAANVTKVFSPAGVRAHILDTVTPFLNERTSDYLNALSEGNISAVWSTLSETAKGELREKFNIDVTNDKGAKSFAGLSGGEKRKVRLATMLALQDLVASRASKPISLYMADEIDDALDTPGIERLMGILEGKARERGTVIVISHNDLNCWIDSVVTVTKSGGVSKVAGALSV